MAATLLPDAWWDLVEPFLPIPPRRPKGGRPRVPDRVCLTGILFVLRSGIPWQMLPHELGCGSGMTCWRRLRDWQLAGVWDLVHFAMLDWLARHDQIDWSRAVLDSCSVRAVCGGTKTGPNPTDRATFAWLNQFRRLRVRYDRRADIHEAFLSLGCALICWNLCGRPRRPA
jgi:transposase